MIVFFRLVPVALVVVSAESSMWIPFSRSGPATNRPSPAELTIPEDLDATTTSGTSNRQDKRTTGNEWAVAIPTVSENDDDDEVIEIVEETTSSSSVLSLKKDPSRVFDTQISTVPDIPTRNAFIDTNNDANDSNPLVLANPDGTLDVAVQAARPVRSLRRPPNAADVSLDPASLFRLAQMMWMATGSLGSALWGTLRVLAPLVASARLYRTGCDAVDKLHAKKEELEGLPTPSLLPSTALRTSEQQPKPQLLQHPAMRSGGRILAHVVLLTIVGRSWEYLLGFYQFPCRYRVTGGCHLICSVLWLVPILTAGHALSSAIALWGGPSLSLQVPGKHPRRPALHSVLKSTDRFLEWIKQPDQWIRQIANERRFLSSSLLQALTPVSGFLSFPRKWEPLWLVMMLGVTKEMTSGRNTMHAMMRLLLLQQAFRDEWHRVLLVERRVLLGLAPAAGYLVSTLGIFLTVFRKPALEVSSLSILFILPSVVAVLISTWMNLVLYLDQQEMKRQQSEADSYADSPALAVA